MTNHRVQSDTGARGALVMCSHHLGVYTMALRDIVPVRIGPSSQPCEYCTVGNIVLMLIENSTFLYMRPINTTTEWTNVLIEKVGDCDHDETVCMKCIMTWAQDWEVRVFPDLEEVDSGGT